LLLFLYLRWELRKDCHWNEAAFCPSANLPLTSWGQLSFSGFDMPQLFGDAFSAQQAVACQNQKNLIDPKMLAEGWRKDKMPLRSSGNLFEVPNANTKTTTKHISE
jgi:hypothetical protein